MLNDSYNFEIYIQALKIEAAQRYIAKREKPDKSDFSRFVIF